ncbi:MAG: (d)CMP kinase, partial [Bacteroidales bacterium]
MMNEIFVEFRIDPSDNLPEIFLNGKCVKQEIRSMRVSEKVSLVSAIPFVRKAMVELQQKMGKEKGVVMDGRDIGTTVFPDAELKIFVTASPVIRAQRRVDEMRSKGVDVSFEEVLKNVEERDFLDQNRTVSPLRKAEDAILLDNSNMTCREQDNWLMEQCDRVMRH